MLRPLFDIIDCDEIIESLELLKKHLLKCDEIKNFGIECLLRSIEYNEQEIDIRIESLKNELDAQLDKIDVTSLVKEFLKDEKKRLVEKFAISNNEELESLEKKLRIAHRLDLKMDLKKLLKSWKNLDVKKNQIGSLLSYCKFNKVLSLKVIENMDNIRDLRQMTLSNDKSKIFIVDYDKNTLITLDLNGSLISQKRVYEYFYPTTICVTHDNKFVASSTVGGLVLHDKNLKLLKKIKGISGSYFAADDTNSSIIYCCFEYSSKIKILDLRSFTFKENTINIDRPLDVFSKDDFIYVISSTQIKLDNGRKLKNIRSGSNCVFVIDKHTLETVKAIKQVNWLAPRSLYVDEYENVWTCAFKILDDENTVSEYRYLFVINRLGEVIQEIYMDGLKFLESAVFVNNKFICCGDDDDREIYFKPQWVKVFEFK